MDQRTGEEAIYRSPGRKIPNLIISVREVEGLKRWDFSATRNFLCSQSIPLTEYLLLIVFCKLIFSINLF